MTGARTEARTGTAGAALSAETEVLTLSLRDPFRIARDEPDREAVTVVVTLRSGDEQGIGEAYPVAYYGETPATVQAVLPLLVRAVARLEPGLDDVRGIDHARAYL